MRIPVMPSSLTPNKSLRARNLQMFTCPDLWPAWPFLPLVKRLPGQPAGYGVLFDVMGSHGLPGYFATVFLTNMFLMPRQLDEFLALPKEVFDTCDELADTGWCVD
jgi:hypothetical protein